MRHEKILTKGNRFMRIIVSFTSYPPRIGCVHKVVKSLYQQTVPVTEIVLYLSLEEFPKAEADLPGKLVNLIGQKGFRIKWVHGNLKSHKKYYYALQEYKDAVVITVDDDKIYADTMIDDLIKSYERFPYAVSARITRIMLKKDETLEPYCRWDQIRYLDEYTDVPRMDLCAIGAGGICYSPSFVNEDWFNREIIAKVAENCDDLWLKYNEIASSIPVVYTHPSQEDITIENSQICRLYIDNLCEGKNDQCIHELSLLLKKQHSAHYQKWFQNLMTWDKYIIGKKSHYLDICRAAFDKVGNIPIYFYGAGKIAQYVLTILTDIGLIQRITAVIVSDKAGNPSNLNGLQVKTLSEIDPNKEFGIFLGVNEGNKKEIMNMLAGYNWRSIELDMQILEQYY